MYSRYNQAKSLLEKKLDEENLKKYTDLLSCYCFFENNLTKKIIQEIKRIISNNNHSKDEKLFIIYFLLIIKLSIKEDGSYLSKEEQDQKEKIIAGMKKYFTQKEK